MQLKMWTIVAQSRPNYWSNWSILPSLSIEHDSIASFSLNPRLWMHSVRLEVALEKAYMSYILLMQNSMSTQNVDNCCTLQIKLINTTFTFHWAFLDWGIILHISWIHDWSWVMCLYELMHLVASPTLKFSNHIFALKATIYTVGKWEQHGIQVMAKVEYYSPV